MFCEGPLRVSCAEDLTWDDSADVVVVGYGGAGACAALAAHELGTQVTIIDRFDGGGATALSGGVYYGGGTPYQHEAGFSDSATDMFDYLKLEVGDAVSEATLRRFCENSAANLEWLVQHGVKFKGKVAPDSAPYMAPGYYLYYSGNERMPEFARVAKPAPRGHIAVGDAGGSAGQYMFAAIRHAVEKSGIKVYLHSPATRLVLDKDGGVIGVEINQLRENSPARRAHQRYINLFNKGKGILYGLPARLIARRLEGLERSGERRLIRARNGVVLSTGGFIHNREMVARYLPRHINAVTLGSAGCTGAGIMMGQSAGGQIARMDKIDTARNLLIPSNFVKGLLVNQRGDRFISEDAYGATIGHDISEKHGGKAWLILDSELYKASWKSIMPWRSMLIRYRLRALMPLAFAWRRAHKIEALAAKCGIPGEALQKSIDMYNEGARTGKDAMGKLPMNLRALGKGPYYAIDCATDSMGFPPTSFTLGGLVVDEASGQVIGEGNHAIPGLFAAGRVAVGIPTNFYVSGLSIADCVFSGRRAGQSVASQQNPSSHPMKVIDK